MGVWSTSLYGGDFAMDLRSAIAAVARLPFDPDRLVDILAEVEPRAATDVTDEDHATFWLVVADQFAKRGLVVSRVREKALELVASAPADAARLGMRPADLKKRVKVLEELRTRLERMPTTTRPRPVMRKPQAFVLDVGQVIAFPTDHGEIINPYFKSKTLIKKWTKDHGFRLWTADGWGVLVVVESGRVFDFLSWYRLAVAVRSTVAKPSLESALSDDVEWRLSRPGTCTALHMKRMEFETLGHVNIDAARLDALFPKRASGRSCAISDISVANGMTTQGAAHVPSRISRPLSLSDAFVGLAALAEKP